MEGEVAEIKRIENGKSKVQHLPYVFIRIQKSSIKQVDHGREEK